MMVFRKSRQTMKFMIWILKVAVSKLNQQISSLKSRSSSFSFSNTSKIRWIARIRTLMASTTLSTKVNKDIIARKRRKRRQKPVNQNMPKQESQASKNKKVKAQIPMPSNMRCIHRLHLHPSLYESRDPRQLRWGKRQRATNSLFKIKTMFQHNKGLLQGQSYLVESSLLSQKLQRKDK